jgi:hypothetical protein
MLIVTLNLVKSYASFCLYVVERISAVLILQSFFVFRDFSCVVSSSDDYNPTIRHLPYR